MKQKINAYHIPVLLDACIDGLNINPSGVYVDATFGGGGHARVIHEQLNSSGHLYALDQDLDSKENSLKDSNFHFIQTNFSFITNQLKSNGIHSVDGILADLGVSSHQFDVLDRGFSIRDEALLDMRMNSSGSITAADILNNEDEEELVRIFRNYGEIRNARKLASEIVQKRTSKPIKTTKEFIEILSGMAPKFKEHKYFAQVFQALRIEVNNELQVLKEFLSQAAELLKPGGRLVVISYHSLEDRLVKNFMKKGNFEGELKKDFFGNPLKNLTEINRKPITPDSSEIEVNSRSRSAKLRIAEKNV